MERREGETRGREKREREGESRGRKRREREGERGREGDKGRGGHGTTSVRAAWPRVQGRVGLTRLHAMRAFQRVQEPVHHLCGT